MVVGGASNLPFNSPSTMAEPTETRILSGMSIDAFIVYSPLFAAVLHKLITLLVKVSIVGVFKALASNRAGFVA